jgi:hypothetical protein
MANRVTDCAEREDIKRYAVNSIDGVASRDLTPSRAAVRRRLAASRCDHVLLVRMHEEHLSER